MTCFCDDVAKYITVFSPWKPEFSPRVVHVGYVVDRMALSQVFLLVLQFLPTSYHFTIPPFSHLLSVAVMMDQFVASVAKDSFSPHHKYKRN